MVQKAAVCAAHPARDRRPWTLALVLLLLIPGSPAAGQWLNIRRGPGLLRLDTQGGLSQVSGNPDPGGPALRFDERIQLQAAGWLVDPRVLTFTTSVTPTFGQHTTGLSEGMGKGQTMAFDVSTVLFPRRYLSFTARTGRTSGFNAAALGARSEWVGRSTNFTVNLRDRYFPVRISYGTSDGTSSWRNTLVRDPFDATRSTQKLQAEVTNPRLKVRYRRERILDQGFSHEGRRLNTTLLFNHRVEWGRGSSLQSIYQLQDREGFGNTRNQTWNESLGIRHTDQFQSRLDFRSRSWSGDDLDYSARSIAGRLLYDRSRNVSAELVARYRSARSSNGTAEAGYQLVPQASLRGGLPWNGSGSLTVAGGFDRFTTREAADDTWVGVVEEAHVVDASLRFMLDNYRIDVSSIQVWTDDLAVLLVEGLDYLRSVLGDQVEIRILPSGRVQAGEQVLVNYRYAALEGRRRSGAFLNAVGTADFGWVSFRAGHSQRGGGDLDAASLGDPGFRESRLSVDLRPRQTPVGVITLSARRDLRRVQGRSSTRDQLDADLILPRRLPVDLSLRAVAGWLDTEGLASSRSVSGSMKAAWRPGRGTTLSGTTTYVVWDRDGAERERFFSVSGSLSWRWREVIMRAGADQSRRWNGNLAVGTRWTLSVIRRF